MSQVSNPYETNTENNLVVTSYIDETGNILTIKMVSIPNQIADYDIGWSISSIESVTPGICGELIKNNTNLNFLSIATGSSVEESFLFIAVDEMTKNHIEALNRNIYIIDIENKNNYINLYESTQKDIVEVTSNYFYYRSYSLYFDPSEENAFKNYKKFYDTYNNKIASFKVIVPELINQDKYLSTNYDGSSFNLTGTVYNDDAFYIDDTYINKYPNTYSKITDDGLVIKFSENDNYNALEIQSEDLIDLSPIEINDYSNLFVESIDDLDGPSAIHTISVDLIEYDPEVGLVVIYFSNNLNGLVRIEKFLIDISLNVFANIDNTFGFIFLLVVNSSENNKFTSY